MGIAEIVDRVLLAREQTGREVAGGVRWRASTLGNCLAQQTLTALGAEAKQFDAKSLKVFEVGHLTAYWIKQLLIEDGSYVADEVPLFDEELQLGCHIDFVVCEDGRYRGIELKSKNSKSFWYGAKQGATVAGEHQLIQAAACAVLAERKGLPWPVEEWVVASVSKDDLTIVEDPVLSAHRSEVLRRVKVLNESLAAGVLPPCDCVESGWAWKFCPWYSGSEQSKKYVKGGAKPDGPCCGEAWLQRVAS